MNTRRCEMPFNYETWFDESDPISSIGILQMMKLTRLKVTKQIKMAPSVKERYDNETSEFLANNKTDKFQQIIESRFVDGFESDTLVYDASQGTLPWFASYMILLWLDYVNLGFILRYTLI